MVFPGRQPMMGDVAVMACKTCGNLFKHRCDGSVPRCPRCTELALAIIKAEESKARKYFMGR